MESAQTKLQNFRSNSPAHKSVTYQMEGRESLGHEKIKQHFRQREPQRLSLLAYAFSRINPLEPDLESHNTPVARSRLLSAPSYAILQITIQKTALSELIERKASQQSLGRSGGRITFSN